MDVVNKRALEAVCAVSYLNAYLDCVESLPTDIQRCLSEIRELDIDHQKCSDIISSRATALPDCCDPSVATDGHFAIYQEVQQQLIRLTEIGDEKLRLISRVLDLIESASRRLELSFDNMDPKSQEGIVHDLSRPRRFNQGDSSSKDSSQAGDTASVTSSESRVSTRSDSEPRRASRSASRTLVAPPDDSASTNDTSSDTNNTLTPVETSSSHRRKHRPAVAAASSTSSSSVSKLPRPTFKKSSEKRRSTTHPESPFVRKKLKSDDSHRRPRPRPKPRATSNKDDDEPRYCFCHEISYGEMIGCDNPSCKLEWFHFRCVDLTAKPKGKWYCPACRRDKPSLRTSSKSDTKQTSKHKEL